jgi:hypothetical protein
MDTSPPFLNQAQPERIYRTVVYNRTCDPKQLTQQNIGACGGGRLQATRQFMSDVRLNNASIIPHPTLFDIFLANLRYVARGIHELSKSYLACCCGPAQRFAKIQK